MAIDTLALDSVIWNKHFHTCFFRSVNKIYEEPDFDDNGKTSAFAILSLPVVTPASDEIAGMGTYEEPNLMEEINDLDESKNFVYYF